jgi:hypothetical protein
LVLVPGYLHGSIFRKLKDEVSKILNLTGERANIHAQWKGKADKEDFIVRRINE